MRPWAGSLTEAEGAAIADYKEAGGREINAALRGDLESPALRRKARRIADAVARAQAPDDLALFRGVGGVEAARLASLAVDDVWQPAAFTSTTLDPDIAERLADSGQVITIRVRRGQAGVAYIHPFPGYRYRQYEALIQHGTKFIVVDKTENGLVLEIAADDHR